MAMTWADRTRLTANITIAAGSSDIVTIQNLTLNTTGSVIPSAIAGLLLLRIT